MVIIDTVFCIISRAVSLSPLVQCVSWAFCTSPLKQMKGLHLQNMWEHRATYSLLEKNFIPPFDISIVQENTIPDLIKLESHIFRAFEKSQSSTFICLSQKCPKSIERLLFSIYVFLYEEIESKICHVILNDSSLRWQE